MMSLKVTKQLSFVIVNVIILSSSSSSSSVTLQTDRK